MFSVASPPLPTNSHQPHHLGPYYGQYVWFTRYHPEKVPSAVTRYAKEIARVVSVIDLHLTRSGQQWLVGDKCTYADLSFINWAMAVDMVVGQKAGGEEALKDVEIFEGGKNAKYKEWMGRLLAREKVAKTMKKKEEVSAH